MPATKESLLDLLAEPLAALDGLDLSDAAASRATLAERFPHDGPAGDALRAALVAAVEDGVICDRGNEAIRYSRLSKPSEATRDHSIDFVWMTGPGINHRHPKGEVNLCFAVEGEPAFDGQPEGWVVFAPGSEHVPTVTDGRMLIVYFLPAGEVEWISAEG
jgi:hypothetical protein